MNTLNTFSAIAIIISLIALPISIYIGDNGLIIFYFAILLFNIYIYLIRTEIKKGE